MKRLIRTVCFLMAAVMLFTTTAFAAESRASDYFMMTSTYLERVSSSKIEIWFDVTAVDRMDELGVKEIRLQRSTDKSNWTTVKTYSRNDYDQMIDYNSAAHADCVTYTSASSNYYYRALVKFYAKKGNGSGMYPVYTATI